ncbi:MAG: hypothetical protein EPN21_05115 [Methylococcaceae bacterium]|nr:MAG: hypothetical protein EPN21_05115 [Methylococcaceae bacterium]
MAYQRFAWGPVTAQLKEEPEVLEARFGEGYAQRSFNGMRNALQLWEVSMPRLEPAFAPAIRGFLADHGGVTPFLWRSLLGVDLLVVAPGWKIDDPKNGEPWLVLNTTFKEVIG